jgi:hypothetical protein
MHTFGRLDIVSLYKTLYKLSHLDKLIKHTVTKGNSNRILLSYETVRVEPRNELRTGNPSHRIEGHLQERPNMLPVCHLSWLV